MNYYTGFFTQDFCHLQNLQPMKQLVEASARKHALLDLLISSNVDCITDVQVRDNLGYTDHCVITFSISYMKEKHYGMTRILNTKKLTSIR